MTGDLEPILDYSSRRQQAELEVLRRRDARRQRALAGLGALLAVGLGFLVLYVLTTWPDAIAAFVDRLTDGSSS